MNSSNEAEKEKENNKIAIFEKLIKLIMSEEVAGESIEKFSRNVNSLDDAAGLVGRMERLIKSKKNNILILAYHQGLIFKKLSFPS